jgi:hypothetical protein
VPAQAFDSWQQGDVFLNQGDNRSLPSVILKIAGATTKVDVVSAADAVAPTDNGEVSATLNAQLINNILLQGRDAGEFLNIMPGIAMTNGLSKLSLGNRLLTRAAPISRAALISRATLIRAATVRERSGPAELA